MMKNSAFREIIVPHILSNKYCDDSKILPYYLREMLARVNQTTAVRAKRTLENNSEG